MLRQGDLHGWVEDVCVCSWCSIASAACWDSRALRLDGEEDWEEVVAVGDEAVRVEAAPLDAGEGAADEYGVVFGGPPTDDEVRAAVASIQQ